MNIRVKWKDGDAWRSGVVQQYLWVPFAPSMGGAPDGYTLAVVYDVERGRILTKKLSELHVVVTH